MVTDQPYSLQAGCRKQKFNDSGLFGRVRRHSSSADKRLHFEQQNSLSADEGRPISLKVCLVCESSSEAKLLTHSLAHTLLVV